MFSSDSLRPAPKATPQLSRAPRPRQGVMPAAHDTARGRYLLPRLRADADEANGGFKIGYMRFFESATRNIAPANMPHRYCMYRLCYGTDARSAGRVSSLGAHDVAHVVSLLGHRRPESVYRELARLDVYRVQLPDLRRQHRAVVLAPSPTQPRQDLYLPPPKVTGRPGPLELLPWRKDVPSAEVQQALASYAAPTARRMQTPSAAQDARFVALFGVHKASLDPETTSAFFFLSLLCQGLTAKAAGDSAVVDASCSGPLRDCLARLGADRLFASMRLSPLRLPPPPLCPRADATSPDGLRLPPLELMALRREHLLRVASQPRALASTDANRRLWVATQARLRTMS